jgi:23S rRNA pseudouridine2457 synthase
VPVHPPLGGRPCLQDYAPVRGVYPARQLDTDGEGLLVLSGEGALQAHVTEPRRTDEPPGLWVRDPPIRARLHIPTAWLELKLAQGKNRQVRRMTAKIGHPTLCLIRRVVGRWTPDGLAPGQ